MKFAVSNKMAGMKPSAVREILKLTADPAFIPFSAGNPSTEAFPEEQIKAFTEEILTENPIAALQYSVSEAVSYTHLDVYKRQALYTVIFT